MCVQIMSAQNNPCVYLDSTSKTKVATETPKKKGATKPATVSPVRCCVNSR